MGLIEKTFRRLRLGRMKEKGDVGMKHCETQNLKFLYLKSCCRRQCMSGLMDGAPVLLMCEVQTLTRLLHPDATELPVSKTHP